jgi:hypothetical protein
VKGNTLGAHFFLKLLVESMIYDGLDSRHVYCDDDTC